MRRYCFKEDCLNGETLLISGDHFQHIIIVCRRDVGHTFEALLPNGVAKSIEIVSVDPIKKIASGVVVSERTLPLLPSPKIHLCLSFPKRETFNRILVKSVELGVSSVHGFPSDFSFRGGWTKTVEAKRDRLDKIIEGALQQSGRGAPMELTFHKNLPQLLEEFSSGSDSVGLLAYENEGVLPLGAVFQGLEAKGSIEHIWIFVGGEGGFSPSDLEIINNFGIIPFGFGDQVLRVETACVAVLGVLKYLVGHYS